MESMTDHTSVRRRAGTQGNAKVALLLVVCAGIVCLIVIRDKLDGGPPTGRRLSIDIALSPNEADPPEERPPGSRLDPPTELRRLTNNNDSGSWRVTSELKLDDDVSPPPVREEPKAEQIGEKPFGPLVRDEGAEDDNKEDDNKEEDDEEEASPSKPDHIASATKYQYYRLEVYGRGFQNLRRSYYLEVVLSSWEPSRWSMSADAWHSLKRRIKALSRGGGTYRCYLMWPVLIRDENRLDVWMVFKIPNGARIKGIVLNKKRLPIAKVVDSGK